METNDWQSLVAGANCPLDAPRPASNEQWDFVAALSASSLYLAKNQTYRGHCQLIFDPRHAARPDQLSAQEWGLFCADLFLAQNAIVRVVRPDHINIESLGNVVPHLHWHIVPRYLHDPRWGAPVWMTSAADMPATTLAAEDRDALIRTIRDALAER
jgi:diadenosine tetraphosphate (Ap4A) HIT family hydrolase